jgi:sugar (pentulose or hexulose) kinase
MTTPLNLLAFDLGAESGRAMLGRLADGRLNLAEVHRFANGPVRVPGAAGRVSLHWDVLHLWNEIQQGIALAGREGPLAGIGVDTWGVDFGLLNRQGRLIGNPYHYRDNRTDGMLEHAFKRVPRAEIFAQTGIQFLQINSLYQLLAMALSDAPELAEAETFLPTPSLFSYWLSGRSACEFSIATTTQCYDPRRDGWATPLLAAMDLPAHIFPEIVPTGTVLGPLQTVLADELGVGPVPIITPACHDTGSAVAAVPAADGGRRGDFAWISSGTWSVMGAELAEPFITPQSLAYDFTNEGGAGHTFRFCKNIMGLWLLQECRRTWANQGEARSYAEWTEMAAGASPFCAVIDVDDGDFLKPGDMPDRIRAYCRRTGQEAPGEKGALVRCILEGIALKYRLLLERLEEMLGRRLEPIHIVGGGAQSRLLSRFTADATGRTVITGPVEATAAGNILVQALALGQLGSLSEARTIVRDSFEVVTFEPGRPGGWDEAYTRLKELR